MFIVLYDGFAVNCCQEMRRHLVFVSTNNFVANTFNLIYWKKISFRCIDIHNMTMEN